MKKQYLLAALASFAFNAAANGADFTFLAPGVRANSMGTAFSTVDGDAYAVFYNPANLTSLGNLEVRFETARRLAPGAPEGESSLAYIRPVPDKRDQVAGFGYYAVRQHGGYDSDTLAFALGSRTLLKYFQQPMFYGGAFKIVSLRTPVKTHLGLGFDAGLRLENNSGLKTALVLSNALFGIGRSMTTLTFGNSYRVRNTTLLADLRTRGSQSEVFFGAEESLFSGLVQARAGKGVALAGGDYLALGVGINVLPWTIDFAWSLPWGGYNEAAGYYGFNFGYRFGAKTFSEKLVGDAARQADAIKSQVDDLRVTRANLESSIATYRVNKSMLETDLTLMQGRLRETEANLKDLQVQVLEQEYRKETPKPAKRYVPPPPERWPKLHKAAAGETLRSIAAKYYGNPNLWERVYEANEKNISKGLPVEGAILTIPPPPRENGR